MCIRVALRLDLNFQFGKSTYLPTYVELPTRFI